MSDDTLVINLAFQGMELTVEVAITRHTPSGPLVFPSCPAHPGEEIAERLGEAIVVEAREGYADCSRELKAALEQHLRTVFPPGSMTCTHCFWDRVEALMGN